MATPSPASPIVSTDAVEVVYPNGTHALHPCSLSIREGVVTVLLGSSGAGKSTLLRCLNGLVRPTRGRVIAADGTSLSGNAALRAHRRGTGMVFQHHHLIGRATVLDNVLTGRLGFHSPLRTLLPWARDDARRALDALARVGLLERALDRADELSGGQQQRVGVARALVQVPRLLLADEPVASLDPATAERLLALLRAICRADGVATVVSLHQVDLARRFADRIVGLRHGRIVFDGPPQALDDDAVADLYRTASGAPDAGQPPTLHHEGLPA